MQRRRLVAQSIERVRELRLALEQDLRRARFGVDVVVVSDVELGAVARREAHGFARVPREVLRDGPRIVGTKRDALAKLDAGAVMRHADEGDPHPRCPAGSPRNATSAKPASVR